MNSFTRAMITSCAILIGFGTFIGAGTAWSISPPQKVIKVIEKTKYEEKIIDQGCPTGTILRAHSEQVSLGDRADPDAWTYGNVITLNVNGVSRICYVEGSYDLSSSLKVGEQIHINNGKLL